MKQLTCEMCGSTDLIKEDGVFVCQTCGCKYSVEEARKMMIEVEGTVDVSGSTVRVDNTAFVEKYLANARRAKEKEDWEETEKYYNLVEQNDPDNIEAIFYSAYGKAKTSLVDDDIYKRQAAFKVLSNCISIIDDHYKPERRDENKEAITKMAMDLGTMLHSNFVYTTWKNGYGITTKTNMNETYYLFINLLLQFKESIDNIAKVDDQIYLHEALLTVYGFAVLCDYFDSSNLKELIAAENKKLEVLKNKISSDAYWEEHPEDKLVLENEKESLMNEVRRLNQELDNLPEVIEVDKIANELKMVAEEMNSLKGFKIKERRELERKIDELMIKEAEVKKKKEPKVSEIQGKIDAANARIAEIEDQIINVK